MGGKGESMVTAFPGEYMVGSGDRREGGRVRETAAKGRGGESCPACDVDDNVGDAAGIGLRGAARHGARGASCSAQVKMPSCCQSLRSCRLVAEASRAAAGEAIGSAAAAEAVGPGSAAAGHTAGPPAESAAAGAGRDGGSSDFRWDVWMLGFTFLLVFVAYNGTQNLVTTMHADEGSGSLAMGVVYGSIVAAAPLGPWVVARFGVKAAIFTSICGYWQFLVANLFPSRLLLCLSAAVIGTSGSFLWISQSMCLVRAARGTALMEGHPEREAAVMGEFSGIFWGVYAGNQVIGNAITFAICSLMQPLPSVGASPPLLSRRALHSTHVGSGGSSSRSSRSNINSTVDNSYFSSISSSSMSSSSGGSGSSSSSSIEPRTAVALFIAFELCMTAALVLCAFLRDLTDHQVQVQQDHEQQQQQQQQQQQKQHLARKEEGEAGTNGSSSMIRQVDHTAHNGRHISAANVEHGFSHSDGADISQPLLDKTDCHQAEWKQQQQQQQQQQEQQHWEEGDEEGLPYGGGVGGGRKVAGNGWTLGRVRAMALLVPAMVHTGLEGAFISGDFTRYVVGPAFGPAWIGGSMTLYGVSSVVACFVASRLSTGASSAVALLCGGIGCQLLACALMLLLPRYALWEVVAVVLLWGLGDAALQSQTNALLPLLFPTRADSAFAQWRMWSSGAASLQFLLSPLAGSGSAGMALRLCILLGTSALSLPCTALAVLLPLH